jgi:ABC-type uncharacterized transport system permease subunit
LCVFVAPLRNDFIGSSQLSSRDAGFTMPRGAGTGFMALALNRPLVWIGVIMVLVCVGVVSNSVRRVRAVGEHPAAADGASVGVP